MFALDEELTRWEAELPSLAAQARLPHLAALAWHRRQRDPALARSLAADAAPLVAQLPAAGRGAWTARFLLVAAEALWLDGALDQSQADADAALALFTPAGDARGCADSHWLMAWIAHDRGDCERSDAELAAAAVHARAAGDAVRADVIDAAAALFTVLGNLQAAAARWGGRFGSELGALHPAAAGWISDFFGTSAFQRSDFGRAIGHLMLTYEAAAATGQRRRAIIVATNIGNAYTSLNAHDAALEWMQRGLDLARPTGWPMSLGPALMQTAETLRQLGQREAAQDLLREALHTLAPLRGSRAYAVALEYQADLALDLGNYAAALDSFTRLEQRGNALCQADFQSSARRGQAHALSHMARPDEALRVAGAALTLAREHGDAYNQIAALNVLAAIHARHALPAPAPLQAPTAVLHYLQLALQLAGAIDGYSVPTSLLDAAARAYAAHGDHARAYEIALQAGAARDQTHSQQATNRAIAMRMQHQTERARTEGEHHRQLAAAEAQRAAVLQQTGATLAHLSAVGQEITAHLDAAAVFRALDRHVHGLLDAFHFAIFLLEPDGLHLRCAFGVEDGKTLPAMRLSLNDASATSARCVRERREILLELTGGACRPNLIPGTRPTLTLLFAPLRIGERVLGVMTAQSLLPGAYGERERLIFRTLCAYGAIALDNASAYLQVAATLKTLSATQAQLLEKNLELERAYRALEEVSLTDQLTGLRNRRYFLQHVDADIALSLRRHDEPSRADPDRDRDLVFFMVDIDHFKEVNDLHGHAAGDVVLVQMQERLRAVFRESDYLIRWGGEEFLVLARATPRGDAGVVAERMCAAVANRPFVLPDGTPLVKTCSIGFACFPFLPEQPRLLSWSQVVELADQGLYIAKRSGRNAWAALYSTARTRADGLFPRLMRQLDEAVADGEVTLFTNLSAPPTLDGDRRRLGLASDLEL